MEIDVPLRCSRLLFRSRFVAMWKLCKAWVWFSFLALLSCPATDKGTDYPSRGDS